MRYALYFGGMVFVILAFLSGNFDRFLITLGLIGLGIGIAIAGGRMISRKARERTNRD